MLYLAVDGHPRVIMHDEGHGDSRTRIYGARAA